MLTDAVAHPSLTADGGLTPAEYTLKQGCCVHCEKNLTQSSSDNFSNAGFQRVSHFRSRSFIILSILSHLHLFYSFQGQNHHVFPVMFWHRIINNIYCLVDFFFLAYKEFVSIFWFITVTERDQEPKL